MSDVLNTPPMSPVSGLPSTQLYNLDDHQLVFLDSFPFPMEPEVEGREPVRESGHESVNSRRELEVVYSHRLRKERGKESLKFLIQFKGQGKYWEFDSWLLINYPGPLAAYLKQLAKASKTKFKNLLKFNPELGKIIG